MKKTIIYSFMLGALLVMSSCTSTIRHNFIIEIDNSRTITETTIENYILIIQRFIVMNMGRYDRITVQFIDECSLTKAERVFNLDLAEFEFTNQSDGKNNEGALTNARLRKFLADSIQFKLRRAILSKRAERYDCGSFTDITVALNEASKLVAHEKSYKDQSDKIFNSVVGNKNFEYENCIVILSDMVNENRNKSLDFTLFGRYTPEQINQKFQKFRELKQIPNLSGCKVLVFGATSTDTVGNANKQIQNCKLFWQNYFSESGAELKGYGYDIRYELVDYISGRN